MSLITHVQYSGMTPAPSKTGGGQIYTPHPPPPYADQPANDVTISQPAPTNTVVIVQGQPQPQRQSATGALVLSCCVIWCCCPVIGLIAYVFASK